MRIFKKKVPTQTGKQTRNFNVDFSENMKSLSKYNVCIIGESIFMGQIINNSGTINGSFNNAGRDNNITNYNVNVQTDINKTMEQLKELIKKENVSEADKECALDSIEVITEQIESHEPKKARIKNAWNNLIRLTSSMPTILSNASKIKDNIEQSIQYIEHIVGESLPRLPF